MLSAESKTRLQAPGLRLPSLKSLPIGSRIALVVVAIVVLMAVFAPLIAPHAPGASGLVPADKIVYTEFEIEGVGIQKLPDNAIAPDSQFWFGTDAKGRDIASRVIFGSRISLIVGMSATGIALLVAAVLG